MESNITNGRGRRIDNEMEEEHEEKMLAMGRDVNFEGLRAPSEVLETNPNPLPTGRNIQMHEMFNQVAQVNAEAFDRDVGESSDEDE